MKTFAPALVALTLVVAAAPAQADIKPCEELKAEIAAKLDAKGVVGYTLTITPTADVKPEDKVVGSCEGGTQKIVYLRGG